MAFIIIAFKSKITYRSAVLFLFFGSIIDIFIKIALWAYLYRQDKGMTEYMVMYTVLSSMIGMLYVNNISGKIGDKIINGTIAIDLLRPMRFLMSSYMQCLGEMLANLLMKGIPVLLVFGIYLWRYSGHIVYAQVPAAIVAMILGHILYMQIFMMIGLMAAVFMEIWAFHRIMNDIILFLSGSFIPLSLFPDGLGRLNSYLPFRFLFSFPLELLLGKTDLVAVSRNFVTLGAWIVFLGLLIWGMNRRMMAKLVIQGG